MAYPSNFPQFISKSPSTTVRYTSSTTRNLILAISLVSLFFIGIGVAVSVRMYMVRAEPDTVALYYQLLYLWVGNFGLLNTLIFVIIAVSLVILKPLRMIRDLWGQTEAKLSVGIQNIEKRLGIFIIWLQQFLTNALKTLNSKTASGVADILQSQIADAAKSASASITTPK